MFTSEFCNSSIPLDICQDCDSVDSHEFATIQEIRLKEDHEGVQITTYVTENNDICLQQRNISSMKNRRNNCYHLLACENCNKIRSICIYQHKGLTYINNDFPDNVPNIPGISGDNRYIGKNYLCGDNWTQICSKCNGTGYFKGDYHEHDGTGYFKREECDKCAEQLEESDTD
jgi:hypothetical protein